MLRVANEDFAAVIVNNQHATALHDLILTLDPMKDTRLVIQILQALDRLYDSNYFLHDTFDKISVEPQVIFDMLLEFVANENYNAMIRLHSLQISLNFWNLYKQQGKMLVDFGKEYGHDLANLFLTLLREVHEIVCDSFNAGLTIDEQKLSFVR